MSGHNFPAESFIHPERMYRLLCDYTYGIISFLELLERLERLERMLHISSSQPELVNRDSFR